MAIDPGRAQSLFLKVVNLPPDERLSVLDQECDGDTDLRQRVEALLRAHDAPDSLLGPSDGSFQKTVISDAGEIEAAPDDAASAPTAGTGPPSGTDETAEASRKNREAGVLIAGRYALQQKLGEGGMGEVWVAQQSEPVKRRVALKLIRSGMNSRDVLARFEQERQALAMMDHPNIARVLDGGVTPEGQPFFVMELVNGLPLTRYCDKAMLTPRERLTLFITICQAVQHAHQKGIVHRDLKPANILVTVIDGRPVPKVIDFGVAKAISGQLTEQAMSTQFGAVIGTLEYMSPEQAGFSGMDVDTRADIYSLGVILYELLTGLRPIDASGLKKAALLEMIRVICEEEPSRPSTRLSTSGGLPSLAAVRQTEPRRLMAMLRGELDWIVMKCLEKSRDRRYESASGLARDIERYLEDEPVEARPPSFSYRANKFLRRNRGPVAAATLVLLVLIGGVIGTTIGLIEAQQQRRIAESQRQKAVAARTEAEAAAETARSQTALALDTLNTVIFDIQRGLENVPGAGAVRRKLLDTALERLKRIADEFADTGQANRQTMVALRELGDVFLDAGNAGADDETGPVRAARTLYERVNEIARTRAAAEPDSPLAQRDLAISYHRLGDVSMQTGRVAEALGFYQQSFDIGRKLARDNPADAEAQRDLSISYNNMGAANLRAGHVTEALAFYRKGLDVRRKLVAARPASAQAQRDLAFSYKKLGEISLQAGQVTEARSFCQQALEIIQTLVAASPIDGRARRMLADLYASLGDISLHQGRLDEARGFYRKGLDATEELAEADPHDTATQYTLAYSYEKQGDVNLEAGELTKAFGFYTRSLDIRRKLATADPTDAVAQRNLFVSNYKLGDVKLQAGQLPEALGFYRQAMAFAEKLAAANPADVQAQHGLYALLNSLADVSLRLGQTGEAHDFYRQGLDIARKLAEADPADAQAQRDLSISYERLAGWSLQAGRLLEASDFYRQSLDVRRKLAEADPASAQVQRDLYVAYAKLGAASLKRGRADEAVRFHQQALDIVEKLARADPASSQAQQDFINAQASLGLTQRRSLDYPASISSFEAALKIAQSVRERGLLNDAIEPLIQSLQRHLAKSQTLQQATGNWETVITLAKESPRLLYHRAAEFAKQKKFDEAAQAAAKYREIALATAEDQSARLYNAACAYGLCAAAVEPAADETLSEDEQTRRRQFLDLSLTCLKEAIAAGFNDFDHARQDPDLSVLRDLPEFQQLVTAPGK